MLATRSLYLNGYSTTWPLDNAYVIGTARTWGHGSKPLLFCHGYSDTAAPNLARNGRTDLLNALAQDYLVCCPDLGGQQWGNDTHVNIAADAHSYLTSLGCSGPLTIVATSMGTLGGLGYLKRHPYTAIIEAFAAVVPCVNIAASAPLIGQAVVDLAYPPNGYNDATDGPAHSPIQYVDGFAPDVPMGFWTVSNDELVPPWTIDQYVKARPQTGRKDLGPLGHSQAALSASAEPVADWLKYIRSIS